MAHEITSRCERGPRDPNRYHGEHRRSDGRTTRNDYPTWRSTRPAPERSRAPAGKRRCWVDTKDETRSRAHGILARCDPGPRDRVRLRTWPTRVCRAANVADEILSRCERGPRDLVTLGSWPTRSRHAANVAHEIRTDTTGNTDGATDERRGTITQHGALPDRRRSDRERRRVSADVGWTRKTKHDHAPTGSWHAAILVHEIVSGCERGPQESVAPRTWLTRSCHAANVAHGILSRWDHGPRDHVTLRTWPTRSEPIPRGTQTERRTNDEERLPNMALYPTGAGAIASAGG